MILSTLMVLHSFLADVAICPYSASAFLAPSLHNVEKTGKGVWPTDSSLSKRKNSRKEDIKSFLEKQTFIIFFIGSGMLKFK